ncbi:MOSC N-terminal beta barrel domain-containing protein [Mucilaginibacter gossypii]|uniref:MOSC domain-containing protein n=1 Tax=Mucilaginibacter gossypii TaxID=551996 RepID=UPI000DCD32A8|nr:MOSC N-terminal beta barrel domain-containing protein [Mucilaginibacter gossypii]QTE38327.1 MOSC N-terminal beta barrel domain-containing protein [Mucilaginibacter gossypii]RAV49301.1 MOSC domain-containing protein [Mucilaginibacter rubeus]
MLQVSELYIYPIKSLGGVAVQNAEVTRRGLQHDRRWMLVNEHGHFITQRGFPQMALLKASIQSDGITVHHQSSGSLLIPFNCERKPLQQFAVWEDTCFGQYVSEEFDEWFSEALNMKCRLIYMPDDSEREVDQRYAKPGMITSFADAYPFLLIGQASLNDLNKRMSLPLPMNRFRPNIVFTGGEAYSEDLMNEIEIAGITFYGAKLCARCVLTTIDQQTAVKAKEPLKTLASYRMKNNKIMFGQNLIHENTGIISVGDELKVLSTHTEERFIVAKKPITTA